MAEGKFHDWLTEEGLLKLEGWARDGLNDEQIAEKLGIHRDTLYTWKKRFPDFSDALKRGKEVVDREVENALFKSAKGYDVEEITFENGKEVKRVTKHVQPNTTAQIFWLKNRKPNDWRDKKDIDANVNVQDNLSPDEREQRIKELMNKVNDHDD